MVTSGLIPGSRQRHVAAVSRRSVSGGRNVSPELPSTLAFDSMEDKEGDEKKEVEVLVSSVGSLPSSSSRSNPSTSSGSGGKHAQEASAKKATDLVRMKHTVYMYIYTSCKNWCCAIIVPLLVKACLIIFACTVICFIFVCVNFNSK